MITIADGEKITWLDYLPDLSKGFVWFDRQYREIRDIHYTKSGIQIELYPYFSLY